MCVWGDVSWVLISQATLVILSELQLTDSPSSLDWGQQHTL